ncbi:MAG: glycosyltransferase [Opitutaceae bacterium]|nr:glycosyltransferase [Opitutaceae bacterium]
MTPQLLNVVHVSPHVQGKGGIEALHAFHRQLPQQAFVALFDRQPQPQANYVNLNIGWHTPLWRMRQVFKRAMSAHAGSHVVYHNAWGLPLFHDLDLAARRVAYLHSAPVYFLRELPALAGLIDGLTGVTPALQKAWEPALPGSTAGRTAILRLPVFPPSGCAAGRPGDGRIVLGYAGRVERIHKRLDRLPALLRELRAKPGLDFRFEVLGDGLLRPALEHKLAGQVHFHGWQSGLDYWRVLAGWDGIVFFSDLEGVPIALIEAMALGVVPFFPAIGAALGDVYVPQVDPQCYYQAGNMAALARAISAVFSLPSPQLKAVRARAQAVTAGNRGPGYAADFESFMRSIAEQPRLAPFRRRRPRLTDLLPLGFVTRFVPWALRLS